MHTYADSLETTVTKVVDGDTFDAIVDSDTVRIRLYLIDCPENCKRYGNQPYGEEAKRFTEDKAT